MIQQSAFHQGFAEFLNPFGTPVFVAQEIRQGRADSGKFLHELCSYFTIGVPIFVDPHISREGRKITKA